MLIKSLHLKNILSFRDTRLDLQPLNVLIGPNGSGKSNLIDVIGLLQAVPSDIAGFLRSNGPTGDWVWKGQEQSETEPSFAFVGMVMDPPVNGRNSRYPCIYGLTFTVEDHRVHSLTENLDAVPPVAERLTYIEEDADKQLYGRTYFHAADGNGEIWPTPDDGRQGNHDEKPVAIQVPRGKSVFSEIRNPVEYPVLTQTARLLNEIKVYRNWHVGRDNPVRHPQRTDGDPNFLAEDFSNLALVVNDLLSQRLEPSLNDYLSRFYESYESLHPRIFGNTIELIVNEAGMSTPLPASRLSDGTIRFIALLSILCHPDPPPLICIEEPEIAMHPDSQDLVVELLIEASQRTQLIVTTHSPWLIDRLSAQPDSVVVCERDRHPADGTQFKRFTREQLEDWLEDQPLGEVWMAGAMGGVH